MSLAELRRREATRDRRNRNREAKEPLGFEQVIAQFQAPYPDSARRWWIESRLEEWRRKVTR